MVTEGSLLVPISTIPSRPKSSDLQSPFQGARKCCMCLCLPEIHCWLQDQHKCLGVCSSPTVSRRHSSQQSSLTLCFSLFLPLGTQCPLSLGEGKCDINVSLRNEHCTVTCGTIVSMNSQQLWLSAQTKPTNIAAWSREEHIRANASLRSYW